MSELSYTDENGNTVFTSQFLRNRKTCCKSACLHCPYGYTLKKFPIQKHKINENNLQEARKLFESFFSTTTQSLLASAFNEKKKQFVPDNFQLLTLKNTICGLLSLRDKKLYLKEHFCDQGITLESIAK